MAPVLQAGAISYRRCGDRWCFLLVTARKDPGAWIFPKGHVEPGESLRDAARRELREEAGVEGDVVRRVGDSEFRSGGEDVRVTYFLVRMRDERRAQEGREKRWLPLDEALALLTFQDARQLIRRAAERLEEP